jgi:hypothetical protein
MISATSTKPKIVLSWQVGQEITGTLINSGSGYNQFDNVTYKYIVETDSAIYQFTAPKMLRSILSKVPLGTVVKIKYDGLANPEWSQKAGIESHPYHHYTVWKKVNKLCPTCGHQEESFDEIVKQRVRNPQYVQEKEIQHPPITGGESRTNSITSDLKEKIKAAITKT